jgi:hypothetical protein
MAAALLAVVGLVIAPAGTPSATAATAPDLAGRQYVALGDSYSAGFGLTPYSEQPASGCYQAEENYPHLVAAEFGLVLDDRTCSGATTLNIMNTPQLTITGAGTAPVQADALTSDTDIVTVTIGGNDLGFADVAETCIAESANGPLVFDLIGVDLPDCRSYYAPVAGVDLLADRLAGTVAPLLYQTFAMIAQRAPNAKVFVIGYPTIAPGADVYPGGCYTSPMGTGPLGLDPPFPVDTFPFTAVDTIYLHETEARLDAAIRAAADANGATYLSTLELTREHSACEPAGEAYISGLTLMDDATPANSTPIAGGYGMALGALHPNTAGVAFLSGQVIAAISEAFAVDPGTGSPDPVGSPAPVAAPGPPQLAEGGGGFAALPWAAGAVLLLAAGFVLVRRRRASV